MANKLRKCRQCGERKPVDEGVITPIAFFCCMPCAVEYAREKSRKAVRRLIAKVDREVEAKAKEERKAERQRKIDVKPIGYWAKRSQDAFNAFIRARDEGLPCVSCGHPDDGSRQRHASHFRSVGASPSTRFMEINVHASCSICNNWLSGNIGQYKTELIRRIGQEGVDLLEGPHEPKRYRREDYQAIEAEYKAKLAELKKSKAA